MVGYATCRAGLEQNWQIHPIGRTDRHLLPHFQVVDLCDDAKLAQLVNQPPPDLLINLAAMTNHTECQNNPELTKKLHVEVPKSLSKWADREQFKLIHISTEAVYGYNKALPGKFNETDPCEPKGVYAITKREGESAILDHNPDATVLRCTPVGFSPVGFGTTLFEWVVRELKKGEPITGYSNAWFTPVSSFNLADLLFDETFHTISGCYNWGIQDSINKYEFASLIARELGYPDGTVIASDSFAGGETMNGALDSSVLQQKLTPPPYDSHTMIKELVALYQSTQPPLNS